MRRMPACRSMSLRRSSLISPNRRAQKDAKGTATASLAGIASVSAWISSNVAGVTFLTRVCVPPPLTLQGVGCDQLVAHGRLKDRAKHLVGASAVRRGLVSVGAKPHAHGCRGDVRQ